MVRPTNDKRIPGLQDAIKETAWKQIAERGAAALSLRAIARELNVTAPAIYNYFPDRDALVTALIIDAFQSLGDSQLEARDRVPPEDLIGRLRATGLAYRVWAHTYPQRYQLIFGAPIPHYVAPVEQLLPSSARSLSALVGAIEQLRRAGKLNVTNFPEVKQEYKFTFEMWKTYGGEVDILSLSVAMIFWAHVHGIVSLEIAGNLPPFGPDGSDLYRYEMDSLVRQFVKEVK